MKKSPTKMGIDFGIANTLYLAFNNNDSFYKIKSAPIVRFTQKLIKTIDNPYEIVDTFNYKTALYVINIAIKHRVSIIQMEDLSGAEFTDNMFYFDLQRSIQTLAEEKHLLVLYVNKDFTSQKCSRCGYIDKQNRISQSQFQCLKCGFVSNEDYNTNVSNLICFYRFLTFTQHNQLLYNNSYRTSVLFRVDYL